VVRESVEPLLDDYRPPGIKSLKFSKFSLGTVSPKIEGIRIQNLQPGQIIMDIDFRWGGDPSIILAVDAVVASLPIQLKDLQVYTVIRVVFQLSEEIPCISAVVVALLADASSTNQFRLLPTFLIRSFRFSVHLPDFLIKPTSFATYSTIVPTFPQQLSF